ncbi:MAG: hypothetical protein JNK99_09530 [Candidatus Accumulibacter sp.]|nr:hypothetical protein [Accumulibacter sp.]MBL8394972.1 hypothetical protein [Accumulibacter sp.]
MNSEDLQLLPTDTMPSGKQQRRAIADLPGNRASPGFSSVRGQSDRNL